MKGNLFRWSRFTLATVAIALFGAVPGWAQVQSGNLYGKVMTETGEPLPGATITLSGLGATQTQNSNDLGEFRFLGLAPGVWTVNVELAGFATVENPNVTITTGRNTSLDFQLRPSLEAVIEVIAEASPVVDERKINVGPTFSQVELEQIPTARDPWALLAMTPAVLTNGINVGGNQSGQQATYISPGTSDDNSVWLVDGVTITDMGAIGSSPSYYNFDSFEEMQVSTGGSDVSLGTAGVAMNMVIKRGTNELRGSGRYLVTDDSWQSDLDFDASDLGPGQERFEQGNAIVEILDYGVEAGGPVVKDRVWAWGSYGVQDIDLLTLAGVRGSTGPGSHDTTKLESWAAKVNAQLSDSNSLTAFYHYGDKIKSGRNASPLRPAPTTWNQSGPTDIYKLEDTQIFGASFFLTGMASYVGGGFALEPVGGGFGDPSFPNVVRQPDRVWQNSFLGVSTDRPQEQAKVDGNYFFQVGASSHELRFGVGYRKATVESFSTWPGLQIVGRADQGLPDFFCDGNPNCYVGFTRTDRNVSDEVEYSTAYVQDTLTLGSLVANLGLRWDLQQGHNNPSTIPAAPVPIRDEAGNVVPSGGAFAGGDPGFEWDDLSPRLGLTYALGEQRKTLLRASYSRFADQLASGTVSNTNPANYQYGFFAWGDNGDLAITPDEVGAFIGYAGIDPQLGGLRTINATDPNLEAPITNEVVLAVEHSLRPELMVGLSATFRRYSGVLDLDRLIIDEGSPLGSIGRPHTAADYEVGTVLTGTLPDGTPYSAPVYTLKPGRSFNGGLYLNNSDREQDYAGYSLTAHKRLAQGWMLRAHVTYSDWTWDVADSELEDPTRLLPGRFEDGGAVLLGAGNTSGQFGNVFINSDWSFNVAGLYQVAPDQPWGFNLAANVSGREGYPLPYNLEVDLGDGLGGRNVLVVDDVERYRAEDVYVVNARVEKELQLGEWALALSLDGFNLLNNNEVLQRETEVGAGVGDFVREVVSPRVFRLGARVSFR
ncbi:MAG TPA: TonB-dependent receptor [Thermoanaerobaculia bacterium]|nr:TonB-dependent receptor [Thermoanaerobaculia bacterium]